MLQTFLRSLIFGKPIIGERIFEKQSSFTTTRPDYITPFNEWIQMIHWSKNTIN